MFVAVARANILDMLGYDFAVCAIGSRLLQESHNLGLWVRNGWIFENRLQCLFYLAIVDKMDILRNISHLAESAVTAKYNHRVDRYISQLRT